MSVELLTEHNLEFLSLKGGCTDSSESTHVKMPHCWKSRVTANLLFLKLYFCQYVRNVVMDVITFPITHINH